MRGEPRTGGCRAWFGARWALREVVCVRWPRGALDSPRPSCWGEARAAGGEGPWEAISGLQSQPNRSRAQSCPRRFLAIALSCSGRVGAGGAAAGEGGRWPRGGRSSLGPWWGLEGEGRRNSTGSATRRSVTRGPERGLGGAGGSSPCRRTPWVSSRFQAAPPPARSLREPLRAPAWPARLGSPRPSGRVCRSASAGLHVPGPAAPPAQDRL